MSKLRHLLVYINIIFAHSIFASLDANEYYPQDLIKNIDTYSKESILKDKLRDVISSYHFKDSSSTHDLIAKKCPKLKASECFIQSDRLNYKQARRAIFGKIDLRQDSSGNYYVEDKYCKIKYDQNQGVGPGQIPQARFINCEHTWPQSRFSSRYSKSLQKNDLHHLYGVNSRSNSARGNIIFGEVNGDVISRDCTASQRGVIDYANSKTKAFEPPPAHRGDVARAVFYFSTRYDLPISDQEEYYLRRWHKEDPVNAQEIKRHEAIFEIQKNRNPYIDDESLVDQVSDF